MPLATVLVPEIVGQEFERVIQAMRIVLQAAAEEVVDAVRAQAVVETIVALVRSRLDNASSLRAWHEVEGKVQGAPSLNQLYEDVGGWDVVLEAVLKKMALALGGCVRGLAILDDTSQRKYGMSMEALSNVHCANIRSPVAGHNIVTLMLEDGAEGVFSDLRVKMNKSRPKSARRAGRLKGPVQEARQLTKRDLALQMLQQALDDGVDIRCVLFDAWYFCADMAEKLRGMDLLFVSRAKSSQVFIINGEEEKAADFLGRVARYRKQVPGTDHYFYQTTASLKNGIQVRLVATWFFQGLNLRATVLVSTDFSLSGSGVVRAYLARWATEQGYKTLKHQLGWGNYHTTRFDKINAMLRIGFIAYALTRTVQTQLGERVPMPTLLKLRRQAVRTQLSGGTPVEPIPNTMVPATFLPETTAKSMTETLDRMAA